MQGQEQRAGDRAITSCTAIVDAAVDYLSRGWRIVPLAGGGRVPLLDLARVVTGPAPDRKQVVHWWQVWPYAALGIATGQSSRLVVVSVLRGAHRPRRHMRLARAVGIAPCNGVPRGPLPETAVVAHAARSHHYFLAPSAPIPTCDIGDVRIFSEAGVVLAPPPGLHSDSPLWERSLSGRAMPNAPEWVTTLAALAPAMRSRLVV